MNRKGYLWVLVFPDGTITERNLGVPATFFTYPAAVRWKREQYLKTPRIIKIEVCYD